MEENFSNFEETAAEAQTFDATVEDMPVKTPGSVIAALIMAIAAVLIYPISCCCTPIGLITLILAIVATVLSVKGSNAMAATYGKVSGLAKATKIISIIVLVLMGIGAIFCLINAIAGGMMAASGGLEELLEDL